MPDIRDTISNLAYTASMLNIDSQRELRAWQDACGNELTMTALKLYEAKGHVDWTVETMLRIQAEINSACALVDERTKAA